MDAETETINAKIERDEALTALHAITEGIALILKEHDEVRIEYPWRELPEWAETRLKALLGVD